MESRSCDPCVFWEAGTPGKCQFPVPEALLQAVGITMLVDGDEGFDCRCFKSRCDGENKRDDEN